MMTSIGGTRRNTVAGGEGSLRDHLGSMFTGHVLPRCPTITFPQSSIIYADSLQQAHKILKDQGYFVVSSEEVELFKASANEEINFKSATKGLTPAFSELRFKREEGKKTFFAKDYKKLRIRIGERGETTDWILMKQAKRCSTSFIINNSKALGGPVTTNSLHGQNSNHEKEKAVGGWRRERKKLKQALKNSPAYIRGSLYTPAKKKEKRGDCEGIKPASPVKHKQMLKRKPRKARRGKGGNNPCKFLLTEMSLGEEDLPDSCASFTSTSESEDWSGSCPSLTSTSETESEDSDDENPEVPHNTPEEQSSDEDKGDPSVAPLRLRGGGGPCSEDEESDSANEAGQALQKLPEVLWTKDKVGFSYVFPQNFICFNILQVNLQRPAGATGTGIKNLGNSCFMGATLQVYYNLHIGGCIHFKL